MIIRGRGGGFFHVSIPSDRLVETRRGQAEVLPRSTRTISFNGRNGLAHFIQEYACIHFRQARSSCHYEWIQWVPSGSASMRQPCARQRFEPDFERRIDSANELLPRQETSVSEDSHLTSVLHVCPKVMAKDTLNPSDLPPDVVRSLN